MSKNYNKDKEIKRLKKKIEYLNQGIKIREDTHDFLLKETNRYKHIIKQLTYLFILMDSLYKLTNNENVSSTSRVIRKSLDTLLAELGDGFLSMPNQPIDEIIN